MRVKICGMTNLEDVRDAVEFGVDFIGFVFYKKSKRFISYEGVKRITNKIGSNVKKVGVFVEQSDDEIRNAVMFCGLNYAQVYRKIDSIDTITVYRIKDKVPENIVDGLILFDSYKKTIGGSGVSFDLGLLENCTFKDRLFVAGGVSVDNAGEILKLGVFGVDLVSSLEAYPGKKDKKKMEEFMKIVRGV